MATFGTNAVEVQHHTLVSTAPFESVRQTVLDVFPVIESRVLDLLNSPRPAFARKLLERGPRLRSFSLQDYRGAGAENEDFAVACLFEIGDPIGKLDILGLSSAVGCRIPKRLLLQRRERRVAITFTSEAQLAEHDVMTGREDARAAELLADFEEGLIAELRKMIASLESSSGPVDA
ncbi:hypothetical protein AAIH70_16500 [Neorhizobium sp. BT27B]|uniref:hypothetical protein n=1 Tax=Neorhizobium sp. BT27B TaxID=3142625 RepID=UPI003D2B93A2